MAKLESTRQVSRRGKPRHALPPAKRATRYGPQRRKTPVTRAGGWHPGPQVGGTGGSQARVPRLRRRRAPKAPETAHQ